MGGAEANPGEGKKDNDPGWRGAYKNPHPLDVNVGLKSGISCKCVREAVCVGV